MTLTYRLYRILGLAACSTLSLPLLAATARPAPPPPPPPPARPIPPTSPVNPTLTSVCLFERPNYQGAALCSQTGAAVPSLVAGWGHTVSSVSVAAGLGVTLYGGVSFSAQSITLTESVPDLAAVNFDLLTASYQVFGSLK